MLFHIQYWFVTGGWWFVAVNSQAHSELDPPYCALRYRRLCQGKGRHVACQFPTAGPGESCLNYTHIKFTKELRHFVTHYINRRRQRLASGNERVRGGAHLPKTEVMMQVEWDRELALLAQRLADQCNFVHDDCRATVRYPYAGQTVGEVKWRRSSESDQRGAARALRRVLDAWWGERRRVTVAQLTQPFRLNNKGNIWGHFSQLAVWTLRAVGCGAVRHGIRYPRILLVCDFSHTNMLGQRTLSPGPMAPCPIHTIRRPRSLYPLLCAPVHQELQNDYRQPADRQHTFYDTYETEYHDEDDDLAEIDDIINIDANTTTQSTTQESNKRIDDSETGRANNAFDKDEILNKYNGNDKDSELINEKEHERPANSDNSEKYDKNQEKNNKNEIKPSSRDRGIKKYRNRMNENNRGEIRIKAFDNIQRVTLNMHPHKERSRYTFIVDEFDDENMKRKYYDLDQKVYEGITSPPRLIQKFEHQLESDINIGPPFHPNFNAKWKQNVYKTFLTNIPLNPTETANLLDQFRETVTSNEEFPAFYEPVRHRWRPTRDRPDRPGAKALLTNTMTDTISSRPRAATKASTYAMKMDQDDIEQLFRDTGFKPRP